MTKKTPPKEETGVTVSFFRGSAGKLWLTLLILSPLFAAAFAVFAFLYADDGMIVIIGCCVIAAIALIVFGVCVGTAGTRTSRWTADETGVSYYRLGRKVVSIGWEEMREAGFLYLGGEARSSRLRLYWSAEELRGKLKSGKFAGKQAGLGANLRGASMIVYTVPAYYGEDGGVTYPTDDPLITYTRGHFRRPLRHEEFLTKIKE